MQQSNSANENKTYNSLLDDLFDNWENTLHEEQKEKFCRDGLIRRPSGKDVNTLWKNSTRRVAFLLKDKSDNSCDDIRNWLVNDNDNGKYCRELKGGKIGRTGFLPNIARMLYGLLNVSIKDNNPLSFDEVKSRMPDVRETWNNAPVALIETKKNAGGNTVSDADMQEALNRDNKLLKKELDILKANILVCCDANDSQFNFVTGTYLEGKKCVVILDSKEFQGFKPCCLYYYPEDKVAVIKSYHPTRSKGKPDWIVYERVVCTLRKLLKENPDSFNKLDD